MAHSCKAVSLPKVDTACRIRAMHYRHVKEAQYSLSVQCFVVT
jgi:hypothetical protein